MVPSASQKSELAVDLAKIYMSGESQRTHMDPAAFAREYLRAKQGISNVISSATTPL